MVIIDLNKIILDICKPGQYSGRQAHSKLNDIAAEIHGKIMNVCADNARTEALVKLYDHFDKLCYDNIKGNYWLSENKNLIHSIERTPSIFRYLLEVTILSGGKSGSESLNDEVIQSLVGAAGSFMTLCTHSDFLYYSNFTGGFNVSSNGEIEVTIDENTKQVTDDYFNDIRLRRISAKLQKQKINSINEIGGRFQSFTQPYDGAFEKKFKLKLTTIAKVLEDITFNIVRKPDGPIIVSHNVLVKRLIRNLKLDKKIIVKALNFFELDQILLSDNWQHYMFYNVPISVSKKPIIRISGKFGKKGEVIFGPNALLRSFVLQFTDIQRGTIDLDIPDELSPEKRGLNFEKKVHNELQQRGYRTLRFTEPPSMVGEIDAVAFNEKNGVVLVVEAKSRKMDLSPKKIKFQITNTKKWCEKLDKKMVWVKTNIDLIAKRLDFNKKTIRKIVGIIVSEYPVYHEELPYKIVTIERLKLALETVY